MCITSMLRLYQEPGPDGAKYFSFFQVTLLNYSCQNHQRLTPWIRGEASLASSKISEESRNPLQNSRYASDQL